MAIGDLPYFLVYGYEPGTVAMSHYRIVEGKPVTGSPDRHLAAGGGSVSDQGVDDNLRLFGVPYRIVGIYETCQGMEESGGVVTLRTPKSSCRSSAR
ncbi:MAG: ABC transporter permease [Caldilineaceae bacterium]